MRTRTGKPGIDPVVWQPPKATERSRQTRAGSFELTVYGLPGAGSEDVALDAEGRVLTGLVDGRILRVSPDGRHIETVADTQGRPLGIEVDAEGRLVVCDARHGLLRVDPASGAVDQLVERIGTTPMLFCNNAALTADGTVYFTDSSQRFGIDHYQGELLAHSGTGRLFRRTPEGTVDLVADGLQFANGVALAPDESWLVVAETGGYCLDRIWLSGPRAGQREPLVENLPAFPDNVSTGSDGLIWVALPSRRNAILDRLLPAPPCCGRSLGRCPTRCSPRNAAPCGYRPTRQPGGWCTTCRPSTRRSAWSPACVSVTALSGSARSPRPRSAASTCYELGPIMDANAGSAQHWWTQSPRPVTLTS
jgi:sugar lactone lactonase YvrE